MPDTPRFDIQAKCIHVYAPKQRTDAATRRDSRERMPEFLENLTPLDHALLKKLHEFPDAYNAVMQEKRRIEEAGSP